MENIVKIVEIPVEDLKIGDILATSLKLNFDGPDFRKKGFELDERTLVWVSKNGLKSISVLKSITRLEDILENELPLIFNQCVKSEFIYTFEVQGLIKNILRRIDNSNSQFLREIYQLKSEQHNTFFHLLDVMGLNIALGNYMGFDEDKLFIAAKCGLLHDVGKYDSDVAKAISSQNGLDENQRKIMQTHPNLGYDFLTMNFPDEYFPIESAGGHHLFYERGTNNIVGYGDERIKHLSGYTLLTRVSDVYGALTSNRLQGKLMENTEAIKKMRIINFNSPFDPFIFGRLIAMCDGEKPKFNLNDSLKN